MLILTILCTRRFILLIVILIVLAKVFVGLELEEWVWGYYTTAITSPGCVTWLVSWGMNREFNLFFPVLGKSWSSCTILICCALTHVLWSQCFTMDEKRSKAVTEAFVRLSNEGLIYRYAAPLFSFVCLISSLCACVAYPWVCRFLEIVLALYLTFVIIYQGLHVWCIGIVSCVLQSLILRWVMLNQVLDVVANISLFTVESCLLFVGWIYRHQREDTSECSWIWRACGVRVADLICLPLRRRSWWNCCGDHQNWNYAWWYCNCYTSWRQKIQSPSREICYSSIQWKKASNSLWWYTCRYELWDWCC